MSPNNSDGSVSMHRDKQMAEEQDSLPSTLSGVLTIKLGYALTDVRRTAAERLPFTFTVQEGLEALMATVKALILLYPAANYHEKDVYLKTAKYHGQSQFSRLTVDNLKDRLACAWRTATLRRGGRPTDYQFEFFAYCRRAGGRRRATGVSVASVSSGAAGQSATQVRIQQHQSHSTGRLRDGAHDGSGRIGPMTERYIASVTADRSETSPFRIPDPETVCQFQNLDRMQAEIDEADAARANPEPMYKTAHVVLNSVRVPVEIDVNSVRRAVGLPEHDMLSRGIFNSNTPSRQ